MRLKKSEYFRAEMSEKAKIGNTVGDAIFSRILRSRRAPDGGAVEAAATLQVRLWRGDFSERPVSGEIIERVATGEQFRVLQVSENSELLLLDLGDKYGRRR